MGTLSTSLIYCYDYTKLFVWKYFLNCKKLCPGTVLLLLPVNVCSLFGCAFVACSKVDGPELWLQSLLVAKALCQHHGILDDRNPLFWEYNLDPGSTLIASHFSWYFFHSLQLHICIKIITVNILSIYYLLSTFLCPLSVIFHLIFPTTQ